MVIEIPPGLDEQRDGGPAWAAWLDRLPRLTTELVEEWALTLDGAAMHGACSLALPVRTEDDEPAVLKITFDGDDESEHEHLALQRWGGVGAVRLLRADPRRRALLLERLYTENLVGRWDVEACEVIAGLYADLHVPAPPQLRLVTTYVARWAAALADMPRGAPIPRRLVEQTLSLVDDLVSDPASVGTMIHGDLHQENVLAADRAPWLAIDPKPMSGDAHYEIAPVLWNDWEQVRDDVRSGVRRRFHTLVDAAGLDEERARDWVVVRMIINAHWSIEDAQRLGQPLGADDHEWITRCIAIAKAVQD